MPLELVTTDGIFALDGGEWEVTNNIWLVGDDREVLVFDAAHDHTPIVHAINGRRVVAVVLTHCHNDHINAAVPLRDEVDAPVLAHPDDQMLWDAVWPNDYLAPVNSLGVRPMEEMRAGKNQGIFFTFFTYEVNRINGVVASAVSGNWEGILDQTHRFISVGPTWMLWRVTS